MTLVTNTFGGVDLLATVKEFDKRLTAIETELEQAKIALNPPVEAVDGNQDSKPGS